LDIKLLDIIACPVCKGKLHYNKAVHELVCRFDKLAYPLEEDPGAAGEPRPSAQQRRAVVMSFVVVIPARYASTRLPGKPLADIHGKPMVQHVVEKASQSGADRVIVATDDERVQQALAACAGQAGFEVCDLAGSPVRHRAFGRGVPSLRLCRRYHRQRAGGRAAHSARHHPSGGDNLAAATAPMATLSVPIQDAEEAFNPNAVKVVTDKDGYALYFSRASIPWDRDRFAANREQIGDHYQRHIGIYAYRAGFIQRYVDWAPSVLEQVEALEQLQVLWYGEKIHVAQALQAPPVGVDTQADLDKVRALLAVEAGGTALMQYGAPGRRFLIDSLYNNLI
jgi:3-deoxy-manno-octulosonate cytidylyltransferase (CMP-KDO synthetase)